MHHVANIRHVLYVQEPYRIYNSGKVGHNLRGVTSTSHYHTFFQDVRVNSGLFTLQSIKVEQPISRPDPLMLPELGANTISTLQRLLANRIPRAQAQ